MIYEFALDPALVAQWSDKREFQRYAGKFGLGTSRVMSRVPHAHWRKLVWQAFETLAGELDEPVAQRRRTWLTELLKRSLEPDWTCRSCPGGGSWYEVARREHDRRAFHALLVACESQPPERGAPVLRDLDFDDDEARWSPDHGLVPRKPEAFAAALAPLLRCAKWIRVVEPHFAPEAPRWRNTIALIAARAVERRDISEWPTIEIHTCVSRGRGLRSLDGQTQADQDERVAKVKASLGALRNELPDGLELAVYFWAERPGEPEFHDRFLLTNLGGLSFGKGFDASDAHGRRDEAIAVLSRGTFVALAQRYAATTADYASRGSARVVGQARGGTRPSPR